jgi:fatty-acyl-CoA synthase
MHLPDLTAKRADLDGDKVALVDVASGADITYADLDNRASRIAEFFRDEWDVGPGDRVAILAHNCTEAVEMLFACAKLHAVMVPLNWRLALPELEYILADASAVGLVSDAANAEMAARLVSRVPGENGPLRSLSLGAEQLHTEQAYDRMISEASGRQIVHEPRDESELWYLVYTAGTTGRPKGVKQTAGMALVNHLNIGTAAGLTSNDTFLSVLPQFHTGGWNLYLLPMIFVGGTTLLPPTFDAGQALSLLTDQVSVFFGVPAVYQMLADHPDFAQTDLSRVRSWTAGGAVMPVPLIRRLDAAGIQVRQGMGMTETGPTVFLLDAGHAIAKAGSVGKPQPFVDVRISDQAGKAVAPGERGELLIRGPGVTPGYWRLPEATRDAFDTDGWLYSGDIATRDDEGYFYIVDRAKDMYISGGENVYPAEVEAVIVQFAGVADCAVVGTPDERWGEVGRAVIEVRPGEELDVPAMLTFCRERLAKYKVPLYVDIVEQIPRNAMGKVQKQVLRVESGAVT